MASLDRDESLLVPVVPVVPVVPDVAVDVPVGRVLVAASTLVSAKSCGVITGVHPANRMTTAIIKICMTFRSQIGRSMKVSIFEGLWRGA